MLLADCQPQLGIRRSIFAAAAAKMQMKLMFVCLHKSINANNATEMRRVASSWLAIAAFHIYSNNKQASNQSCS